VSRDAERYLAELDARVASGACSARYAITDAYMAGVAHGRREVDALLVERDRRILEVIGRYLEARPEAILDVRVPTGQFAVLLDRPYGDSHCVRGSSLGDALAQLATVILAGGAS
jgi:hypothetical protein